MWDDVLEFTRQLEHDDAERDRHSGDSRKEGRGADHGEDAWRDTRDSLANEAAEESAGVEGRDDDSGGDFAAKGDGGENKFGEGAVDKPAEVFGPRILGFLMADPGAIGAGAAAVLEQILDDHVARFTGYGIGVLKQASGEDYQKDFKDGVGLDEWELSKGLGPEEVAFAEDAAP